MAIRKSSISGTPSGNTASRPANPQVGATYNNGTLGIEEIYTASGWVVKNAIPAVPTSVVATNQPSGRAFNNGQASVAITDGSGGGLVTDYIVTPSPATSPSTFTGSSSPITVTGLQSSQQYTYTTEARNNYGTSAASAASAGVTATTVPQAPTINSVARGAAEATITFTAGATGGSAITSYTVTSSPGNITASGASSPITVTGLTNGTSYTFTVTATNANGTSLPSAASNSITPVASLSIDYLVVAGGGSSGEGYEAGPGGAGGLRSTVTATGGGGSLEPALSCVPGTSYTVTVGAGATKPAGNTFGIKGSNSVFATVTSQGGGGGGVYDSFSTAMNGGSGGGTSRNGTPGSGTANQGYNGANPGGGMESGGGGGAGAAGSSNGNGGIGVAVTITESSTYYAGGGAGSGASGVGGLGGGGNQSSNGAANTGGGAGGTRMLNGGANGGSGVVILRWVTADTSINVGAGLTADATGTDGIYSYKRITAGTGTISFS